MTREEYLACLSLARRFSRRVEDAPDLLHDALLAGVRVGRVAFTTNADRAWLTGVMRNLAAMTARAAARRRSRETAWARDQATTAEAPADPVAIDALLDPLSEGTRRIAVLALHGMTPDEIRYVLGLRPAAFRQRLSALRRALGRLPEPLRAEALALAYSRPRRPDADALDFGLIRRALHHHVRSAGGIGTHDHDGHLIGIRASRPHDPAVGGN